MASTSTKMFLVVFFLALALRIAFLPYAKFENETARDITIAQRIFETGKLPLHGVLAEADEHSEQQSFGPVYYYLIALFLMIYNHPFAAVFLMVVLSMLAVFLTYILVKRFFGEKTALVASALFAFSPWFIAFVSLNLMTPAMLIPFVLLLFYSVFKIVIEHKDLYFIVAAAASAIMLQFHLSALAIIFTAFVILACLRPKVFVSKYAFGGVLTVLVVFVPFFAYSFQHDSWTNIFSFLSHRYESSRLENICDSIGIPFMLATTYFGKYLLGSEQIFRSALARYAFYLFDALIVLLMVYGIFLTTRSILAHAGEARQRDFILLAWLAIPILVALVSSKNISPHYLLTTYPTQFIFLGRALIDVSHRFRARSLVLTGVVCALYILFILSFFVFLHNNGGTDGIYGIPLEAKINVLEYLQHHGISDVYFYGHVKGDYELIAAVSFPRITVQALPEIKEGLQGYLVLDLYSRGNFAEQRLSEREKAILKKYETTKIGQISIVHFT